MSTTTKKPRHGADLLKRAMEKEDLSQGQLAKELKTHQGIISHILRKKRPPTLELSARIQARFGIPPAVWVTQPSKATRQQRRAKALKAAEARWKKAA